MLFGQRINKVVAIGSMAGREASMQSMIADPSRDLTSFASVGLMLHLATYVSWNKGVIRVGCGCSKEVPEDTHENIHPRKKAKCWTHHKRRK
jgi:hypothetical protein